MTSKIAVSSNRTKGKDLIIRKHACMTMLFSMLFLNLSLENFAKCDEFYGRWKGKLAIVETVPEGCNSHKEIEEYYLVSGTGAEMKVKRNNVQELSGYLISQNRFEVVEEVRTGSFTKRFGLNFQKINSTNVTAEFAILDAKLSADGVENNCYVKWRGLVTRVNP